MFRYLFTFNDQSKWLSQIGWQLNELCATNGHLISEDIQFIDSIISNNNEIDHSFQSSRRKFPISFRILWLCSLIAIIAYWCYGNIKSLLSVISILTLTLFIISLPFVLKTIYKFYLNYSLMKKVKLLSHKILLETDLIKKLLKLIEANEVIEKSDKVSVKVIEMKRSFRFVCWHLFSSFRNASIQLRNKYPLKSEIDDEINFLCCLPFELFDNYLADDAPKFTVNFLKSLRQLMRLQQSEFFRRLICIFIQICWNQTNKETNNIISLKGIKDIFDNLIYQINEIYKELYSSYSCANTYWIISEKSKTKSFDRSNINRSENVQLIDLNRSIRKYLLSILSSVDDCDTIIEDNEQNESNNRFSLTQKIDCINADLSKLSDLLLCLEKNLNIKKHKDIKVQNLNTDYPLHSNKESINYSVKRLEEINDYIATDQVFESFNTNDNCEHNLFDNIDDVDESWEYRLKLAQEAEASSNLFRELKVALKSKAVEHKLREAKAQGIEIDALNVEQNSCDLNKNNNESDLPENDSKFSLDTSKHIEKNMNMFLSVDKENTLSCGNQILFASQIASIAAEKGRMFGVCDHNTECFGDDGDDQTEHFNND